MKKLKYVWSFIVGVRYMKYIVVLVLGFVLIGFVGSNSVLAHLGYKQRISELRDEIAVFDAAYNRSQQQINQLRHNPKAMERLARERYFMKHDDEDIFVLSDDERQPYANPAANETVE